MRLIYTGEIADGIDVPRANIGKWMPGETWDVPDEIAESLLERVDEFRRADDEPEVADSD
jgi:hypothetical protein